MLLGVLQEQQPALVTVVVLMLQLLLLQLQQRLPLPVPLQLCPALRCPALWLAERAVRL